MQYDITDGVLHLTDEGIADAKQIGFLGTPTAARPTT